MACGDCPYAEYLLRAGIDYHGVDILRDMLHFAQSRISETGMDVQGRLHAADMRDFSINLQFDLAFVLMGSLHYLDNKDFLSHLEAMKRHIVPGGVYVLEWCIHYSPLQELEEKWSQSSPIGEVAVIFHAEQTKPSLQQYREKIQLYLNGELKAESTESIYPRYPNEFKMLIESRSSDWDMLHQCNDWNLDAGIDSSGTINRPLCILKRKG
jgi:cyclopropane fatty-acyl-phospholipid synthase-like methyltransferase